jgi:hypothetical protein
MLATFNIKYYSVQFYKRNIARYIKTFRRQMVVQSVEALPYKAEVSGFDSRWYHWSISLT